MSETPDKNLDGTLRKYIGTRKESAIKREEERREAELDALDEKEENEQTGQRRVDINYHGLGVRDDTAPLRTKIERILK